MYFFGIAFHSSKVNIFNSSNVWGFLLFILGLIYAQIYSIGYARSGEFGGFWISEFFPNNFSITILFVLLVWADAPSCSKYNSLFNFFLILYMNLYKIVVLGHMQIRFAFLH